MSDNNEKPISVREFRMWLQGVEEMQEDSWTPSPSQWKRIRAKIDSIADAPAARPAAPPVQPPITYAPTGAPTMPATPAGPSSLMVPAAPTQLNPLLAGSGGQIKTPDIDTSKSDYQSGFV